MRPSAVPQLHEVGSEQEDHLTQSLLLAIEGEGAAGHEISGALRLLGGRELRLSNTVA